MSEHDNVTVFARAEAFPPARQTWFRAPTGGSVVIGCPVCGQAVGIRCLPHTVKPDGMVTPSYVCGHGCGFHALIQLKGLEVPAETCPTCAHPHPAVCPTCGCLAGTPEGRPQPVARFSPLHRLVVGRIEGHVVLGVGDETALSLLLVPEQAESLAGQLLELARLVREPSKD